ncbi:TetR/AcrR family transcriptional regulator [Gordonia crocea]|uniref:Putative transcriptional regulator, TetR family protein n=1 Tax=Gordonia crocea TaxID=589162 RepID=A0A7I9V1J2_9ACTN|nr:TetR/AcrR family transcriptional regulator [Gordonia crocea]GED99011.1 putative transcriptional regulator, TetR family protein [Gordonia crocea]
MGRPAKHSTDDFLDAAVAIYSHLGARAVTLGAVAKSVGAANGSIYHRFPDRPALLRAMWERTAARFQSGYRENLGEPTITAAIESATWVVHWCRDHLDEARVLLAGARTFGADGATSGATGGSDSRLHADIRQIVDTLAPMTAAGPDQIAFALFDLPIAVVIRPLHEGRAPGAREAELVRDLVTVILRPRP